VGALLVGVHHVVLLPALSSGATVTFVGRRFCPTLSVYPWNFAQNNELSRSRI
jgi:hypothetical protein